MQNYGYFEIKQDILLSDALEIGKAKSMEKLIEPGQEVVYDRKDLCIFSFGQV